MHAALLSMKIIPVQVAQLVPQLIGPAFFEQAHLLLFNLCLEKFYARLNNLYVSTILAYKCENLNLIVKSSTTKHFNTCP